MDHNLFAQLRTSTQQMSAITNTKRDWSDHPMERKPLYTLTRIYIAELWLGMQK